MAEPPKMNRRKIERHRERIQLQQAIFRSDGFEIDVMYGYLDSENRDSFHHSLNERRFPVGSTDATSRLLNGWEAEGVVDDPRPEGQGWRRYSVLEVIWLHAALHLRRFGLSVQSLIRARHTMNEDWPEFQTESGSRITLFEVYVLQAMQGVPVFLLVFEDGTAALATDDQYDTTSSLYGLADHVRIELNRIIQRAFPKLEWPKPKLDVRVPLADDEAKVVWALRSGNYISVMLTLSDGRVKTIRAREEVEGERIIDILKAGNFQDIEIKQRDGKVVHLTRTFITEL